jgi:hypothetical protein
VPRLPVVLKLHRISRSGLIKIGFNQKLKIPARFTQKPKRYLTSEDDVFAISVGNKAGARHDFDHTIVGWTADDVQVQLEFDNPVLIS